MQLLFSDRIREGHEQCRSEDGVTLFVHGIGFVVVDRTSFTNRVTMYGKKNANPPDQITIDKAVNA